MSVKYEWKVPNTGVFNPNKAKDVIEKASKPSIDRMLSIAETNIKLGAPVGATTLLRNTIQSERQGTMGRVFTGVDYATVIEYGRRAAPVAREADASLSAWIRRSQKGQAYFSALKKSYPGIKLRSAIYILKRSLARRKRKANPFFTRGVARSTAAITKEAKILLETIKRRIAA